MPFTLGAGAAVLLPERALGRVARLLCMGGARRRSRWPLRRVEDRRGGRAAEGTRLEIACTGNGTEGSNPSLSATAREACRGSEGRRRDGSVARRRDRGASPALLIGLARLRGLRLASLAARCATARRQGVGAEWRLGCCRAPAGRTVRMPGTGFGVGYRAAPSKIQAPIAQLDRAPGCGPGGRKFESCWARQQRCGAR